VFAQSVILSSNFFLGISDRHLIKANCWLPSYLYLKSKQKIWCWSSLGRCGCEAKAI